MSATVDPGGHITLQRLARVVRRADAGGRPGRVDRGHRADVGLLTAPSRRAVLSSSSSTITCASPPPMTSSAMPSTARLSAPMVSPLASPGSQRSRWAGDPACSISAPASTLGRKGTGASVRPSSSHRIDSSIPPRPWPPCSSLRAMPGQPSSQSSAHSASSVRPASACSRTRSGRARSASRSRAVRWISRWSSVRPKSIVRSYAATLSRGSPRTRSATMFLSTSVVPPSIVLPRARSCS